MQFPPDEELFGVLAPRLLKGLPNSSLHRKLPFEANKNVFDKFPILVRISLNEELFYLIFLKFYLFIYLFIYYFNY